MKPYYKKLGILFIIALSLFMLFREFKPRDNVPAFAYSEFIDMVENGRVLEIHIQGNAVSGLTVEGPFTTYVPADPEMINLILSKGVKITAIPEKSFSWAGMLISWIPILLLVGVWLFFIRQAQGGSGKALSFGKSRARLMSESQTKITFRDVAGIDEAREELEEIVNFLQNPEKYTRLGGRIPKGILLVGPPGTGKTLLARAIAGEAGVPFLTISGSDFVEMFAGVGASRVRDLFIQGKRLCQTMLTSRSLQGEPRGLQVLILKTW